MKALSLRKRTHEAYWTSPYRLDGYPIETPHPDWSGDKRFWDQLDPHIRVCIYCDAELYQDGYFVGRGDFDSFDRRVQDFAIRRGQWSQLDKVEVDMHWGHDKGTEYERYALRDVEWEDMTPDEQRRFMAL
jgi:hypothetical protein